MRLCWWRRHRRCPWLREGCEWGGEEERWGGREVWSAVRALQDGLIERIGFSARATLMIQDAVPGKEATSDRCLCILRVS